MEQRTVTSLVDEIRRPRTWKERAADQVASDHLDVPAVTPDGSEEIDGESEIVS